MNKLIEEAENLYKQIDKAQVHLINARLSNDEQGKKSAISEMETAMCNAMQLLKCFIERKANIVDLSEIWHNSEIEPEDNKQILHDAGEDWFDVSLVDSRPLSLGDYFVDVKDVRRWAYVDDLLPKGGEK